MKSYIYKYKYIITKQQQQNNTNNQQCLKQQSSIKQTHTQTKQKQHIYSSNTIFKQKHKSETTIHHTTYVSTTHA